MPRQSFTASKKPRELNHCKRGRYKRYRRWKPPRRMIYSPQAFSVPPMSTSSQRLGRYAFGPFEVNTLAGEVRNGGVRIKLSGQPYKILLILLSRPGELVTREEFRRQLWPEEIYVDFEHGLNAGMNRLRRALN